MRSSAPPIACSISWWLLDTLAGILVVLGAAWLVWTRPGAMTWGFFVYVIQFNPGQAFQFYAWLQQWPQALLVQDVVSLVMQAAAYTGLLLFALRAPVDRAEGRWRVVERALPALAILFLLATLPSLGTVFGYRAEIWLRSSLLLGFAVSVAALGILLGRRRDLSPRDYQRIRWVIWGCLIGLPAYLLAELSQETSLLDGLLGEGVAPEEVAGLLYLINGVLCLFVAEAVRRPTVINVWIPLRRATVLGLLLSVPVLFLHKQIETIDEYIHMPDWAWVLVASGLVYVLARAHESATELVDRLFDREFIRAERRLAAVGETIQHADSLAEIERLLVEEPMRSLKLASAALFREQDGVFRRRVSAGWDADDADTLTRDEPLLAARFERRPYALDTAPTLSAGPMRAFRATWRDRFSACRWATRGAATRSSFIAATRPEPISTAPSAACLGKLAHDAEIAYAQIESETLRKRVNVLEDQLARVSERR